MLLVRLVFVVKSELSGIVVFLELSSRSNFFSTCYVSFRIHVILFKIIQCRQVLAMFGSLSNPV